MSSRRIRQPLLIGHRGASGYRPEHTRSAYLLAFEQGVDAVEPDVVVSSDGVLVIRHENEISTTTDVADRPEFADRRTTKTVDGVRLTGWFAEDFTWAELQTLWCRERLPGLRPANTKFDATEPMLSLSELLRLVDESSVRLGREISLVVELKHAHFLQQQGHDLSQLLRHTLERAGWSHRPSQLTVESFELSPLERLSESGLEARLVFLLESEGAPADEVATVGSRAHTYEWYRSDAGLDVLRGRVHGVSLAKRDLLQHGFGGRVVGVQDVVERAHKRGLSVFTWTLRPENRFLSPGFRRGSAPDAWGDWQAEWQLILSTGVDGVFLDHPDLFAQLQA